MRFTAVLVLVGCGSSIPYEDYAAERTAALCDYYVRCGAYAAADCTALLTSHDQNPNYLAAINTGRIRYDGEAGADCLDTLADFPCDRTLPLPDTAACAEVYTGTGKLGSSCSYSDECASEHCAITECDELYTCCFGTCMPMEAPTELGIGEVCEVGDCQRGLYCSYGTDVPRTCTPLPKHGEPCTSDCAAIGDTCDFSGDGTRTKTCLDAAVGGEPCELNADCAPNHECTADNLCVLDIVVMTRTNGMPCGFDYDCRSWNCDENKVCSPQPLCE